jgi:hypothetical protein
MARQQTSDTEISGKPASGSNRSKGPRKGGSQQQNAQQWGGGSKASKGPITDADKHNPNSSAKS